MGQIEPTARRGLLRERAEEIAAECLRNVFASADVRFRARFGIYARSLKDAQDRSPVTGRRQITIPHLILEDVDAVAPHVAPSLEEMPEWRSELERSITSSLTFALEQALHTVEERGLASLSRSRIAIYRSR